MMSSARKNVLVVVSALAIVVVVLAGECRHNECMEQIQQDVRVIKVACAFTEKDRMTYDDLPETWYKVKMLVNQYDGTAVVQTDTPHGPLYYLVNGMPTGLMEIGKSFQVARSPDASGWGGWN